MLFPRICAFFLTMTLYYYSKSEEDEKWRELSLKRAEALLSPNYCENHCILNALTYAQAQEFLLKCFDEFRNLSKQGKKTYIRDKLRHCIQLRTAKHKNYKYIWKVGVVPNMVRLYSSYLHLT